MGLREPSSKPTHSKSGLPSGEYNSKVGPHSQGEVPMHRLVPLAAVALLIVSAPARADDQADAKALLDKAFKAHGGDAVEKIKAGTISIKGKFYGMGDGIDYTGTISFQLPDKQRLEIESEAGGMKFKFVQVFNKDKGWNGLAGNTVEMDKDAVAEVKEAIHAGDLSALRPSAFKDAKLSLVGEVKVNDKPAVGLRVEVKGKRDVTLFFDKETHLLVKRERRAKDPQGGEEFGEEEVYSDFKEVGGVKMSHKVVIKHDGKVFIEGETTEYKTVEKFDDAQFAKP
jgi:hypothetical protein